MDVDQMQHFPPSSPFTTHAQEPSDAMPITAPLQVDTLPIWSPERGSVGERFFRDADEERTTKDISIEDTAYWFAENNGE